MTVFLQPCSRALLKTTGMTLLAAAAAAAAALTSVGRVGICCSANAGPLCQPASRDNIAPGPRPAADTEAINVAML